MGSLDAVCATARILLPRNSPPPRSPPPVHERDKVHVGAHSHAHTDTLSFSIFLSSSRSRDHDVGHPLAALTLLTAGARARHHYLRQIICERDRPVGSLSRTSRILPTPPHSARHESREPAAELNRDARARPKPRTATTVVKLFRNACVLPIGRREK